MQGEDGYNYPVPDKNLIPGGPATSPKPNNGYPISTTDDYPAGGLPATTPTGSRGRPGSFPTGGQNGYPSGRPGGQRPNGNARPTTQG